MESDGTNRGGQRRRDHAALRDAAAAEARRIIAARGPDGLNARDLAQAVGCSVGTIYNLFPNLDSVRFLVNGETLDRLLVDVRAADASAVAAGTPSPEARLIAQARAYVAFARRDPNLYAAMLDRRTRSNEVPPDWFLAKIAALRRTVEEAIAPLFDVGDDAGRERAATIVWASVNGLGEAALTGALRAITATEPDRLIADLIRTLVAGFGAIRDRSGQS